MSVAGSMTGEASCEMESAVMDFTDKRTCELHALLITHIYTQKLDSKDTYASYVGCVKNSTIEKLFEIR